MGLQDNQDFSITIDFDKHSPNPSRVFKAMSSLIETFETIDKGLVKHLDNKINTVLLLEDVEKGSLKTILRNVLQDIPDDALQECDLKKIVGHYLVKAKYILLNSTTGKASITDGEVIDDIDRKLLEAASETGVDQLPMFVPISKRTIVSDLESISKSIQCLNDNDKAWYDSQFGRATFNLELTIDSGKIEDMLTRERYESETPMILKVKKPDYLGDSMWDFKHGAKTISAKISDKEWLNAFQNRKIDVRPQDSIVCNVRTITKYDQDFEPLSITYDIIKVVKINPRSQTNQSTLEF